MPLEPAPPVLGPAVLAGADDEARLRSTARRQWAARRDLERRLHDGAALRISALTLQLGLLRHRHPDGEQEFSSAVDDLQDELHVVLQELRDIAGQLYPPLLDEAGLGPALREAAARCPAPVHVDAPDQRFGPDVEGAVYFAVLGFLPDVPTAPVDVVVRHEDGAVVVLVSGPAACQADSCQADASRAADGVRLLGGTIASGPLGTTVRIPCA